MRLKWKEGRSLDYQKLAQYSSGHIHHLKLNFVDFKGMTNEWIEEFARSGIEPIKANLKHFEVAFNAEIIDAKLIAFAEQIIGKLGE
jgi:LPS sulfotransferase NodH